MTGLDVIILNDKMNEFLNQIQFQQLDSSIGKAIEMFDEKNVL